MSSGVALPMFGRTRWRRVGILFVPALALVAVLIVLIAKGALAFNFAISGVPFTLSADSMTGDNFVQYGFPDQVTQTQPNADALIRGGEHAIGLPLLAAGSAAQSGGGHTYVADTVTSLDNPRITNLNQVICAPVGNIVSDLMGINLRVTIKAGTVSGHPAAANHLTVQAPGLVADSATFTGMAIGADAGYALGGAKNGLFSQAADTVNISGLHQLAVGTEAGTFTLPNLALQASFTTDCSAP